MADSDDTMEESDEAFAEPYLEEVTEATRIRDFIKYALVGEERVEIQLGKQVRVFYTQFVDQIPEPVEEIGDDGEAKLVQPYYPSLSYLHDLTHVLVEPILPVKGTLLLRKFPRVGLTMRFFNGEHRVEAKMRLRGMVTVEGRKMLKLSFPKRVELREARRHFRVPVTHYFKLALDVQSGRVDRTTVTIRDLSLGGLSFCHGLDLEQLPQESKLQCILTIPDEPIIKAMAYVRNHSPVTKKMAQQRRCRISHTICGLQFDMTDAKLENRLSDIVGRLQLEYIGKLKQDMEPYDIPTTLVWKDKHDDPNYRPEERESSLEFYDDEEGGGRSEEDEEEVVAGERDSGLKIMTDEELERIRKEKASGGKKKKKKGLLGGLLGKKKKKGSGLVLEPETRKRETASAIEEGRSTMPPPPKPRKASGFHDLEAMRQKMREKE
ncbi:MAG: PilZ domain-containing protein [Magnetococcales bacterium]|nr:PilZ domain-containing protein [Magnetococcales bacterium]